MHNARLHVATAIHDPENYEIFPAELVGRKRNFVLDKMAGMQTIKQKLEQIGITVCEMMLQGQCITLNQWKKALFQIQN